MKQGFMSFLGMLAGILVVCLLGFLLYDRVVNKHDFETQAQRFMFQRDSLKIKYSALKESYDSLVVASDVSQRRYAAQLSIDQEKMKVYKNRIYEYEALISIVNTLPDSVLLGKIAGYYRDRFGYGR